MVLIMMVGGGGVVAIIIALSEIRAAKSRRRLGGPTWNPDPSSIVQKAGVATASLFGCL